MDSAILWLLGAASVLTIVLFVVKGLLDQLPDVFASWHRAKRAFHEGTHAKADRPNTVDDEVTEAEGVTDSAVSHE